MKVEHNQWSYIYFFMHLDTTRPNDYTALELYVSMMVSDDYTTLELYVSMMVSDDYTALELYVSMTVSDDYTVLELYVNHNGILDTRRYTYLVLTLETI